MQGIEIAGLVKTYPRSNDLFQFLRHPRNRGLVPALQGVDLQVPRGGIYALLGPNGAGKTTLLKVLAGLLLPNAGSLKIDGEELSDRPTQIRKKVGLIVCDERSFYWRLSAWENLRFFAALNGFKGQALQNRVDECLRLVGLEQDARRPFMSFSTGMRQKLAIARGLILDPSILLMDEPTRSLDPEATIRIHEIVTSILEQDPNRIIFYSTHNLHEAASISNHVIVLRNGRIVRQQSLDQAPQTEGYTYRLRTQPALTQASLPMDLDLQVVQEHEDGVTLELPSLEALNGLLAHMQKQGLLLIEATQHRSSLGELYHQSASLES